MDFFEVEEKKCENASCWVERTLLREEGWAKNYLEYPRKKDLSPYFL